MTRTPMTEPNTRQNQRGRRGVAMLMVVIALVITTVLTSAVLTSPDRMDDVARNAQDAAKARWSAESASNFTVAAISQDVAATDVGGLYKSDWRIAQGDATVIVTNSDGDVPTVDDRTVFVTVSSKSGGISKTTRRQMIVTPPVASEAVTDTRLGELAIFARDSLRLDGSSIGTWDVSPDAKSGTARIGLGFDTTGGISSAGSRLNGAYVVGPSAGAALLSWAATQGSGGVIQLPVQLPQGSEPTPDFSGIKEHLANEGRPLDGMKVLNLDGVQTVALEPGRYESVLASGGAVVELDDGTYVFDEIQLKGGAVLQVNGNTQVVVMDRVRVIQGAQVRMDDDASLHLWVGQTLELAEGGLTCVEAPDAFDARWFKNVTDYDAPSRILVEINNGGTVSASANSVLYGTIHAPGATIGFEASMLVGRVTGADVSFVNSMVRYDPALDSKQGYTNLAGPMYDTEGSPIPGLEDAINASLTMDPDDANALIAAVIQNHWTTEGAPDVSASGYWDTLTTKLSILSDDSHWQREQEQDLIVLKERWLADTIETAKARVLEGLTR